jgi:hypothetical protein
VAGSPKQRALERRVFDAFLAACPTFAARVVKIEQPEDDPPDIITSMTDESSVDWELGEWLHEKQMGESKRPEARDLVIAQAVPAGPNRTVHLYLCMLTPREVRFDAREQ